MYMITTGKQDLQYSTVALIVYWEYNTPYFDDCSDIIRLIGGILWNLETEGKARGIQIS